MKKLVLVVFSAMITSLSIAQKTSEKEIPEAVKTEFQKMYPTAKEVKWDIEKELYEASFDLNKIDHSVLFDSAGNIKETEVEIELSTLPNGVLDYVKAHYASKAVKEAAKIIGAKGEIQYEVEIKGMDILFDQEGNFIKEVVD